MIIGSYRRSSRAFRDVIVIAHNCTNSGRILEGFSNFSEARVSRDIRQV